MTAELLEFPAAEVRVRRGPARRPASTRHPLAPGRGGVRPHGPRQQGWASPSARACEAPAAPRPVPVVSPTPTRLEWTPRGLAVMLGLIATVVVLMLVTAVGAFLSVSDAPAAAPVAAAIAAPAAAAVAVPAAAQG